MFWIQVIAGLWVISIVGNCTNFLTLFYIGTTFKFLTCLLLYIHTFALAAETYSCVFLFLFAVFVTLHTVPFLYDKYEDQVDAFGEKATVEFKKLYAVVHAKYLSKIPKGPLKDKKSQ